MAIAEGDNKKFEDFRNEFPALAQQTYLSICDKMILHNAVRAGIDNFLDHLAFATENRVGHEVQVTEAREKFAQLMSVSPATIAAVRNVSDGVNSVVWALDWQEGDNVILTAASEHPNNVYPWLRLIKRGVEVRVVPPTVDAAIDVPAMIAAIDSKTRAVSVASATFAPGHRTNLQALGEACDKHDVLLIVDGVQTAGILNHDLGTEAVGAFVTSTSKGLLGLYGFGFLYVSPKWIDRMSPAYLSRASILHNQDDHSAMGGFDYQYQPGSRRFEVGSFNLAGAYAANVSLGLLLQLGVPDIESHVLELAGAFHEGLRACDLEPAIPGHGPQQSHIITLGKVDAGGHGFSTDPLVEPLSEHLNAHKVAHTIRRGQLRFGLHAYNSHDDIHTTLDIIRDGLKVLRR